MWLNSKYGKCIKQKSTWYISYLLVIILSGLYNNGFADERLFNSANNAFKAGKYQDAIKLYDSLLILKGPNHVLYYNLGNCYYKSGNLGKAILYYEKCLLYHPGDEDAEHNLRVARAKTIDKIDTVPGFFIFRWVEIITGALTTQGWLTYSLIIFYLLAFAVVGFLLSKNHRIRRWLILTIVLMFTLFIVTISTALYRNYTDKNTRSAVAVQSTVTIKYAPDENSSDAFIIHEGLKLKIEDKVDRWYKIRLEDGKTGWVKENSIELI